MGRNFSVNGTDFSCFADLHHPTYIMQYWTVNTVVHYEHYPNLSRDICFVALFYKYNFFFLKVSFYFKKLCFRSVLDVSKACNIREKQILIRLVFSLFIVLTSLYRHLSWWFRLTFFKNITCCKLATWATVITWMRDYSICIDQRLLEIVKVRLRRAQKPGPPIQYTVHAPWMNT